jgi:glycine/D-amino acid oxidase-like deaminating enzyme
MKTPEGIVSPEVYIRADGTVYMCGDHSDPLRQRALTNKATDATPSDIAIKHHTERLAMIGEQFKDPNIVSSQACFRPESRRRVPIIGKLHEGIWIASGHSVWGICNGPGTGKLMVGPFLLHHDQAHLYFRLSSC